jgi:integrase
MSRRPKQPSYCHHKKSGRAYVTIDGKQVYLGAHGSEESYREYDRAVGEYLARRGAAPIRPMGQLPTGLTVSMLLAAFWAFAEIEYPSAPHAPGKRPSGELGNYWDVLKVLKRLYGPTPAAKFDCTCLEAVREDMIKAGCCRNYVNRQASRVRRIFKWGASKKLVEANVWSELRTLDPIRRGRGGVRETKAVKCVSDELVEATRPFLGRHVRAMVDLQLETGARPGELCAMCTGDIDTTREVWIYRPRTHKNAHRGHAREIRFGPKARAILAPFLKHDLTAHVFNPAESEADRHQKAQRRRRRAPGDHYDVASYRRAITRACRRAFPAPGLLSRPKGATRAQWLASLTPEQQRELRAWEADHHWHPHQLRHNFGTKIFRKHGEDVALVLLGDKSAKMIDVYCERDTAAAERVIAQVG